MLKVKAIKSTWGIAKGLEVTSVKWEEKPADSTKAVVVELSVSKELAAKIEKS